MAMLTRCRLQLVGNWYDMYLCPAARACSGREALGEVDEAVGSDGTVEEGETAPIRTMSCALCRRLRARRLRVTQGTSIWREDGRE